MKGFAGLTVAVLVVIGTGAAVEAWTSSNSNPSAGAFVAAVNRLYRQATPDEFTATLITSRTQGLLSESEAAKRVLSLCNEGVGARVETSALVRTLTSPDPEWAIFVDPPGKHVTYPSLLVLRKVRGSPFNWVAGFVDAKHPLTQIFCTFGYDPRLPLLPVFAPTFISSSTSEATTTGTPSFPSNLGTARRRLQQLPRAWATSNGDTSLHSGIVYLTTREQAAGGDVVNSNQPVYELVLRGRFVCYGCSRPAGAPVQRGTVLTVTVDRATFEITDFGLGNRLNPPLPHAKSYVLRF